MVIDLRTALPRLLPRAVAWAEQQQANILASGFPLSPEQITVARTVGVSYPQNIRIRLVNRLPLPDDPELAAAALQTGLLGPNMTGLTLYYGILICDHAYGSRNLIAHEYRHVHQHEQRGSIAAFLQEYLLQIVTVGYDNAPFERDACVAAEPYT
jgi:hypothetical protein